MNQNHDAGRAARWEREAAFFDGKAAQQRRAGLQIPPETVDRYRALEHPYFPADWRFIGIGGLEGKRVLDIGCGDGRASVLLALLGASVTGIDVSPDAITAAAERAEINEVTSRANFVCAPLETVDLAPESFDVIWCDAFLHHVIPELPDVLRRMRDWLAPGGVIMINEPVSLSRTFRTARLLLLPAPDATPDERPLEPAEIALIADAFPNQQSRYFGFFARVARFVLPAHNFERASSWRQALFTFAARLDAALLRPGLLRNVASTMVIHGIRDHRPDQPHARTAHEPSMART